MEWIGSGQAPVSPPLAERRASTCAACEFNVPGHAAEAGIAERIRQHESVRHKMSLATSQDDKLQGCAICKCYLKLKVWVPLNKVLRDTDAGKMPDHCWVKTEQNPEKPIVIRRTAAFGDVIAASVVAERIAATGRKVRLLCNPVVGAAMMHHPRIEMVHTGPHDIDLDATYELSPEIGTRHLYDLLFEPTNRQLKRLGLQEIGPAINCVPRLGVSEDETTAILKRIGDAPHPWVAVIPRSAAWFNRTVADNTWLEAADGVPGTMLWLGQGRVGKPLVDLHVANFREVMAALSVADLVVSVDTGPMHAAAAFRKPILAIKQAFRIDLRLTDHTDWQEVGAPLDCLGCCKYHCPIDRNAPPCAAIEPSIIRNAILRRLGVLNETRVAAVIAVLTPVEARLKRCIAAIEHQVDEIVIAMDGPAVLNLRHPKVRVVQNPTRARTGWGKTTLRGARQTDSAWILFLNDDCYLDPGAVGEMLSAANPKTAIVGCLLRYPDGTIQHGGTHQSAGSFGWGHIDHRKIKPTITKPTQMEGVTLAAALVRRKAFYEIGGIDAIFDCYGEDYDLCRTIRKEGWNIVYQPNASGIHEESQTSGAMRTKMLAESHAILAKKWGGRR